MVQTMPNDGKGGKNCFLKGNIANAPGGPAVSWVEVTGSLDRYNGVWSLNIYDISVPQALADQEMATVLGMLPSYKTNYAAIMGKISAETDEVQQITSNALRNSAKQMLDASDRSTQATTDYLLNQTVVSDSALNGHGRWLTMSPTP